MAVIRSYNQPTVEARPAPNAAVPMNAPVGAFGNAMQTEGDARAAQTAGAYLERASDTTGNMALSMMAEANEARVQELANGFISGQQFTLYTDKDAFYRKRGQDAINGAQAATDKLLELKKEAVEMAANPTQRRALEKMLNAQVMEANNGISRHVAQQSVEWQKNVAEGRQTLIRNQAALDYNDFDKITGLADAAETAAKEQARLAGVTGTDAETALVAKARSDIYATSITQLIQNDRKRSALALYDRSKDKLDEKDSIRLASALKSTATEVEAEDWIAKNTANSLPDKVKQYAPQVQKAAAENGVDPVLALAVVTQESGGNTGAVSKAGARGLMQLMPGTATDLGVKDPHDPGQNIPGGVKYLGQQINKYGDETLGLMAYNWGPGNVDKWIKAGKNPAAVPEETREYVQKVQGYALAQRGVGTDKANSSGLVLAAQNDPNLSTATKTAITTMVNKASSTLEATRSATIKGLDDMLEATSIAMIAAPASYKKGTLSTLADGFEAAGERSKAMATRLQAQMEDTILSFSSAPKDAQDQTMRQVAASILPGKSKALADSLIAEGKKGSAEAAKQATEDFSVLKTAASNGVRIETLADKAKGIVETFAAKGDIVKAREAQDWFNAQVAAQSAGLAPAAQLTQVAADMKTRIESGENDNAALMQLDALETVRKQQAAQFSKDALAAGASIYSQSLGPLPPATDLPARSAYASNISSRQGGITVLPFTDPEITQIRTKMQNDPPEAQAKTMQALAVLPAEQIPALASALAGKGEGGDQLSRSYAAALSFYAEKTPESKQVADQILSGAKIIKDGGDGTRKPATTSDTWQAGLQERTGNLFRDADPRMAASVTDAIASVYVHLMSRAGRQGEKTDTDILDAAIKTVIGSPVVRNGQSMLPPYRNMTAYDVDKAMRSLSDGDLEGLRTSEGDPVTADKMIRQGILTNGQNGEGWYFVRIPDPRAGMDPRPVVGPDGRPFQLDLRPLVERAARFPEGLMPTPDATGAARRRAPASPTDEATP